MDVNVQTISADRFYFCLKLNVAKSSLSLSLSHKTRFSIIYRKLRSASKFDFGFISADVRHIKQTKCCADGHLENQFARLDIAFGATAGKYHYFNLNIAYAAQTNNTVFMGEQIDFTTPSVAIKEKRSLLK